MPPGFRILPRARRIEVQLVERFCSLPAASVSDAIFLGPILKCGTKTMDRDLV